MATLGSEVSRLLLAKEQGDMHMAGKCFKRAQKILDQIISVPEMQSRRDEIELLKSVIDDLLRDLPLYAVKDRELKAYLLHFSSSVARQLVS